MKFDIVQAWKDDSYRASLSDEQLSALPVNPAGELTDAELSAVAGGFDGSFGSGFGNGFFATHRNESVAVICEINVFSLSVISNIAILGAVNQICAKG